MKYADKVKLRFIEECLEAYAHLDSEIIELGSGNGWLASELRRKGWNVTTLDRNGRADITIDFNAYEPEGNYDAVIAVEFLEHGFWGKKVVSMLKKGGILIATFPNPKYDGLMGFLSWNNIYNAGLKKDYLEHINLFEPESIPLRLLRKKSIFEICYLCCWKND